MRPNGVNLCYFKLRLFDLTEIHSLKYLRFIKLGCKDIVIEFLYSSDRGVEMINRFSFKPVLM